MNYIEEKHYTVEVKVELPGQGEGSPVEKGGKPSRHAGFKSTLKMVVLTIECIGILCVMASPFVFYFCQFSAPSYIFLFLDVVVLAYMMNETNKEIGKHDPGSVITSRRY